VLAIALVAVIFAGAAHAATYYVSPRGDDARSGTSPGQAWQTLTRVNNATLRPGDSVLLEGGQSFEGPLVPWTSGQAGAPITFGSYGSGQATIASSVNNVVWLPGASWVTIENLRLTSNGNDDHVIVSNPQGTNAYITIRNCLITNTRAFGINSPSLTDHDWTIQGNTISQAGETGITFRGSNFKVIGNVISDTGLQPREASHGVYAKGPAAQVIGNTITNFDASGVSIRYQNTVVRGNWISGGAIGIGSFQDGTIGGVSTIAYNRISNVSNAGIYLDGSTIESFVIASNTIRTTSGNGLNAHRVKALTLVNNLVTGTFDRYAAAIWKPAASYVENHNLWYPGSATSFVWNGSPKTFADYRSSSGQGAADLLVDPQLTALLVPKSGSPALDAGSRTPGLSYRPACDGQPFSYCDKQPDLGAVEVRIKQPKSARPRRGSGSRRA
jgi:hypothetical protein